jgi:molybdopterin synthase catalytic subunit
MRVRVLFFGRLKEITGCNEDWAELGEGARVEDLFTGYSMKFRELGKFRPTLMASVNEELAAWDKELRGGDEVAFLPPVSGGTAEANAVAAQDVVELVRAPLSAEEWVAQVKSASAGAVVVFDGMVRDNSQGRRTLYLDYEAYESMALKQMREIVQQMRRQFRIDRAALLHRLGRLAIGETSVLVVVSAPHRAPAFEACRFAIEALKRSVPIWKKEYFADGAVWVEGATAEPVPQGAARPFAPPTESTS